MALKDIWNDIVEGDFIDPKQINDVAHGVIDNENRTDELENEIHGENGWNEQAKAAAVIAENAAKEAVSAKNQAVEKASIATEKANIATEKANEAAESADNASASEKTATDKAREAGESANVATEAKEAAEKARDDAENAADNAKIYIEKSPSRNILNVTWENAKLASGVFVSSTSTKQAAFADFIHVVGGENYTLSWITSEQSCYVYLHKYKDKSESAENYIGFDVQKYVTTNKASEFVYSLEEECKYIRIFLENIGTAVPETWEENIPENFQMELGTEATTYVEPFTIDAKIIDDITLGEKMITNGVIPKADNYLDRLPLTETLPVEAWETGGLVDADGSERPAASYRRTKGYVHLRKGDKVVSTNSSYNINVYEYDLITLEHITNNKAWTRDYTVKNDCLGRILLNLYAGGELEIVTNYVQIHHNNRDRVSLAALPIDKLNELIGRSVEKKTESGFITNSKFSGSINDIFRQISHRGFRATGAPECTAPAYIEAKKFGYIAGENDLWVTSDGVFVMCHGTHMPSDTNKVAKITDSTYETLLSYNMGVFNGKTIPIMTFEEWIILMKKLGLEAVVDLKSNLTTEQAAEAVSIVKKHGMLDKTAWSTNAQTALRGIRATYPLAKLMLMGYTSISADSEYIIENRPDLTVFYPQSTLVTEDVIANATNAGVGVECWYVDYPSTATKETVLAEVERVLELGVTGICLDTYLPCEYFIEKFNSEWGLD